MHDGVIGAEDPRADDVRALLARHLTFAHDTSPPQDVHALDIDGLLDPAISFFSLRVDGEVLAVGALKQLDAEHVEIKSMHTAEAARRRGLGRAMVEHLVAEARQRGYRRISLETGATEPFVPARSLYASLGFTTCGPFADYGATANSAFMTMTLDGASDRGRLRDGG